MAALEQLRKSLHKSGFYFRNAIGMALPHSHYRRKYLAMLSELECLESYLREDIYARVDYYNKLSSYYQVAADAEMTGTFDRTGKSNAYFFDLKRLTRFFPDNLAFSYIFGDVTHVPEHPSFVKSRPITEENQNSILLKLNQVRHYYFVRDPLSFEEKTDSVVWRGKCNSPDRLEFVKRFHAHPLCNAGDTHRRSAGEAWHRPFMTMADQLRHKFVLSIEGNDVATNLKWIMASNSLCFMKRPRFETWFMEGRLVPGHHYVELRDDFSDLEDKVLYYSQHTDEAVEITRNAQWYVAQFMDREREDLISLLVMKKHFELSGQI